MQQDVRIDSTTRTARAATLLLILSLLVPISAGGCSQLIFSTTAATSSLEGDGYEWREDPQCYHAAEAGQRKKFTLADVHLRGRPFDPWIAVLVEGCREKRKANEKSLSPEAVAAAYADLPGQRYVRPLLNAADYLNRDVAPSRQAYVIGIYPLAVAFLSDTKPAEGDGRTQQPVSTTRVEPDVMRTRKGTTIPVDYRRRHARLVSGQDLGAKVDSVLRFPLEMQLGPGYGISPDPNQHVLTATLYVLRKPVSVSGAIDAVLSPGVWADRVAEKIELTVTKP